MKPKSEHDAKVLHQQLLQELKDSNKLDLEFFCKDHAQDGNNISKQNLKKVFELIDKENTNKEEEELRLDTNELKKKIQAVVPNFPQNEFQFFTGGKTEFEFDELYNQLNENHLNDFDPIKEGFKVLAGPEGHLDAQRLDSISQKLGYGEVNHRDMKILLECMDMDKDGKISLGDFQSMVEYLK